jgi:alkanesulfonate monooxygenase SsuD/methylene tetrahydromethanopterin reductase-like flavin-dependent oxidoreductase (luciferase family)
MHVGIQFPSSTIGQNPADVRAFAVDAEAAGFHHLSYGEHILWAVKGEGDARASHTYHDVLTTMAYHAAVTSKIELFAAIFVLPQRQAQLVAKQCAQVDLLSGGRSPRVPRARPDLLHLLPTIEPGRVNSRL